MWELKTDKLFFIAAKDFAPADARIHTRTAAGVPAYATTRDIARSLRFKRTNNKTASGIFRKPSCFGGN